MTGWPVLEIELLWIVLFSTRIWQYMPNTSKYHNHLSSQFQPDECIWKSTLLCIAFRHFPDVSFIRLCPWSFLSAFLHCASPLMIPSSPDTKPWPLQGRCCCSSKTGPSGLSSVSGPRPEPDRRHMTWETRMKHTVPQSCENLPVVLLIFEFRFHAGRPTLPGQLTAWLKK